MAVRKQALTDAGSFDERLPAYGEESKWEDRLRAAGGQIVYLSTAWLWHRRTPEHARFRSGFVRSFRRGRGNGYYSSSLGHESDVGLRNVLFSVGHAARRRCQAGVAARVLGGRAHRRLG